MGLKDFFSEERKRRIKDIFYPDGITCNACGKELDDTERYFSLCAHCSMQLGHIEKEEYFDGRPVHSVFHYEGIAKRYVLHYKDADEPYLAEYIAKHLFDYYSKQNLKADCVTYVPTAPKSIKRRGYDGMKLVAEAFSRLSNLPLKDILFRKDGMDQTLTTSAEGRRDNVRDKFLCRAGFCGTVLLLDDLVTSGATLNSCAEVVGSHGAERVVCLTFARVRD